MNSLCTYANLSDICQFINGDRGKNYPSGEDFVQFGVPFINAGHIGDNKINFENMNYITEEKYEILGSGKIEKNDILYCLRGSLGKNAMVYIEKGAIASSLVILRGQKGLVDSNYLLRYLNSPRIEAQINRANNGSSQPNLSAKSVKEFKVFLPTINVQIKIAKVLDKAQELIDKRKEQIQALDELIKSQFMEMFGDPFNDEKGYGTNKLGEVTEINPKKSEIKELDKELIVSFVPMDRVGEKGEFNPEVFKRISEVYSGFTYFKDNDVLFAKITPCMENGKGAIAKNLSNAIGFGSTEFHVLRPIKKKSNKYWIYNLTTLIEFRRLAERKMTGSAGQKRVSTEFLNNIEIVIPPIELQNQFADFVKQVDRLKVKMEKSLKELEDNFNSLMQRAFNGELFSE